MKWLIIVFIVTSLIGSVMWVMPTPRQRFQAKLRMSARGLGLQVQLAQLKLPRQRGEVDAETIGIPVYRMLRTNLSREEKDCWNGWQVCRRETLSTTGLPPGWSWIKGEGQLSDTALAHICGVLERLPTDVVALESTVIHASAFWQEGDESALEQIAGLLEELIESHI